MSNREFIILLVQNGYISKTEFATKNNLVYQYMSDTLSGRKSDRKTLDALSEIGVSENDLPLTDRE